MSIADEISRISASKDSIKASIEDKGVTVPDSATIDSYGDYVADIQSSTSPINGTIDTQVTLATDVQQGDPLYIAANWVKMTNPSDLQQNNSLALSPDGTFLAIGNWATPFLAVYKRNAANTGWSTFPISQLPNGTVYGLDFSPDGKYLAVANGRTTTGAPINTLYQLNAAGTQFDFITPSGFPGSPNTASNRYCLSCAFSPNGE